MLNLSTESGVDEKMSMLIKNHQSLGLAFTIIETKKKPSFLKKLGFTSPKAGYIFR